MIWLKPMNGLVSYLLSMGAEITPMDHLGKTFLTVAAENQNLKALSALNITGLTSTQEAKPKISYKTIRSIINTQEYTHGYTPLMYSASQGDIEMAKALLRLGADTTMQDAKGRTAIELSILNGFKTIYWMLQFYGKFTIQDVLAEAGLEKYTGLFANTTSEELLLMDDNDLKKLGMKLLGPRKKLTLTIEKIKEYKKSVMNQ
uniref:Ankyrin repeat and MYND domain-containing protein 2 n=1 Tax=Lygus hesperus TaxID=30085 RepID=A0A0A9XG06_LYGHE